MCMSRGITLNHVASQQWSDHILQRKPSSWFMPETWRDEAPRAFEQSWIRYNSISLLSPCNLMLLNGCASISDLSLVADGYSWNELRWISNEIQSIHGGNDSSKVHFKECKRGIFYHNTRYWHKEGRRQQGLQPYTCPKDDVCLVWRGLVSFSAIRTTHILWEQWKES